MPRGHPERSLSGPDAVAGELNILATKKEPLTFSQREILTALNNAVVMSRKPARLGEIPDKRLAHLRQYALALVAPTRLHMGEDLLRPEEVVHFLTTAALFFQAELMGTTKFPAFDETAVMYGEEDAEA